ncbi:MAG: hypothetical protein ACJAUP_002909 [Cellvibrionaceae bacterium]|jgi:hypothetical protein
MQQFYQTQLKQAFFQCRFDKETEKLIVLNGLLTKASNIEAHKLMQKMANSFNELIKEDMPQTFDNKAGVTVVLALRQWQYSLFDEHLKR